MSKLRKLLHRELKNTRCSQNEIARQTGVSQSLISNFLRKPEKTLELETIERLLAFFGYTITKG